MTKTVRTVGDARDEKLIADALDAARHQRREKVRMDRLRARSLHPLVGEANTENLDPRIGILNRMISGACRVVFYTIIDRQVHEGTRNDIEALLS